MRPLITAYSDTNSISQGYLFLMILSDLLYAPSIVFTKLGYNYIDIFYFSSLEFFAVILFIFFRN